MCGAHILRPQSFTVVPSSQVHPISHPTSAAASTAIRANRSAADQCAGHFEATTAAGGVFKTKAKLDGGSTMDVSGTIKDGANKILLDGYCKFGGPLAKKQ